ncbi:MAG TPA: Uma2 family endonuclease [Kofleriaceae bacterium]
MSDPVKKRATYQDVRDAHEHTVAEIVDGELRVSPRPGAPHTSAASSLMIELGGPFQKGTNGPGGWIILVEPELHLGEDVLVPDVAGWRVERMPTVPEGAYFALPPDWVCEVLSLRTAVDDRLEKLPIYAAAGVRHAWLIDAANRSLEVFRLHEGHWLVVGTYRGSQRVRAEPFDAIELDLGAIWAYLPSPGRGSRASEPGADYAFAFELEYELERST